MTTNEKVYGIEVICEDLGSHPICAHGPTLLFSRRINKDGSKRNFYACSAYRDRKGCPFFMWTDEQKINDNCKKNKRSELLPKFDHEDYYLQLKKIREAEQSNRSYCHTCNKLLLKYQLKDHVDHNLTNNLSSEILYRPMCLLKPLNENKKEAQYLFSQESVDVIVNNVIGLGYRNLLCIGAPMIHEHVQNLSDNKSNISSLLLDIDARFHSFYNSSQYCWYNSFNHHFFSDQGKIVFQEFLKKDGGKRICLIMDPPFGGRLEPLSQTLCTISSTLEILNNIKHKDGINLPVILIMPYFMEPLIKVHMSGMSMCDYKVTYRNHSQFKNSSKSKQGSIVRLFTNIPLSKIILPSNEYKFCEVCERWVSYENSHCYACNSCTSKDGRTYVHCKKCDRCVKPTWDHCKICARCCLPDHKCKGIQKEEAITNKSTEKLKKGMVNCFKNKSAKVVKKGRKKNKQKQKIKAILFNQSKVT